MSKLHYCIGLWKLKFAQNESSMNPGRFKRQSLAIESVTPPAPTQGSEMNQEETASPWGTVKL